MAEWRVRPGYWFLRLPVELGTPGVLRHASTSVPPGARHRGPSSCAVRSSPGTASGVPLKAPRGLWATPFSSTLLEPQRIVNKPSDLLVERPETPGPPILFLGASIQVAKQVNQTTLLFVREDVISCKEVTDYRAFELGTQHT